MKKSIHYMEAACSYFICILMLVYGIVKVCRLQFSVEYYLNDTTLGQLNGTQLTWAFYNYHPAYQVIIGLIEVTVGLLVLFPRTRKLGIVLFVPLSLNIMLLNLMFDIAALLTSVSLFIAGCILLAIYSKNFIRYFFSTSGLVAHNGFLKKLVAPSLAIITGCILALFVIYHNQFTIKNDSKLIGKWEIKNHPGIQFFYFEKGDLLVAKTRNAAFISGRYKANNHSLNIKSKNELLGQGRHLYRHINDSIVAITLDTQQYILNRVEL